MFLLASIRRLLVPETVDVVIDLFVVARNTAFTYKGKAVRIEDVGRELGVRYVVEGSVRRAGER